MAEMGEDMVDAFGGGEDGAGAATDFCSLEVDMDYEFHASRYFDFCRPESPWEARDAELWFDSAGSYPPSPLMSKINIGENILEDNVNTSPKFDDGGETNHVVYSDIGSCKELLSAEETNTGVNIDIEMLHDLLKADLKSAVKLPFSSGSTLMKPTASQLAKQSCGRNIKSSSQILDRFQKPPTQNNEKNFKGALYNISQASKRQKLEGGHSIKVHDVKQQTVLVHKIPQKKEEHSDRNPGLPKLKLTIPRGPELGTARRAQRIRPDKSKDEAVHANPTINMFRARPLNRKILEAPSLPIPQKSTPRLPEFQEFHLKTSERAIQHASASSSQQVQNDLATSDVQEAAKGNKEEQPHSSNPPCIQKLHSSNDLDPKECKKDLLKFKAQPLNKKTPYGKGDIDIFCSNKRGFKFKTEQRCPQNLPIELFNKLSLTSEDQQSSTSETKVSYASDGSKENIVEHGQQVQEGICVSKAGQHIIWRRQVKCDKDVVVTHFPPQLNLCRAKTFSKFNSMRDLYNQAINLSAHSVPSCNRFKCAYQR